MDISVNWLKELAPALSDEQPESLARRLTMSAVAVEEIRPMGRDLQDLVVARVLEARPHPGADRLTLCRVDAGDEPTDVVCGAPNVEEGALYPYVAPGGSLPGGTRIESREIRGRQSHGMLCSERELGLGERHEGILRLPEDLAPGTGVEDALQLPDHRLVLDLTPNRVDLACHVGVARELAPGGQAGLVRSRPGDVEWDARWEDGEDAVSAGAVPVRIEDLERCPRYLGAVVRDVEVRPSPSWLAARVRAAGARPVNNVVDATNYVLFELNQPLHAFDLGRLSGPEIRVRRARAGEELRTLDGVVRELDPVQTVIADRDGPVALAGVMGGEESEVGAETTDLFIECALFDPLATRRGARHAGLSTEASYRFERGIDPRGLEAALTRCVELILSVAGGEAELAAPRTGGPPPERRRIRLRSSRNRQVLGQEFSTAQLTDLLSPLGFDCRPYGDDQHEDGGGGAAADGDLEVVVPGWRGDVTREIDLVEEVARRFGYDEFPREPRRFRPSSVPEDPAWVRADRVRSRLAARGLLEARSLPFLSEEAVVSGRGVRLQNPLSEEESHLRDGVVPVLLGRLEHNFARGERSVRLFELGSVFAGGEGGRPDEELRVGAVLTGHRRPEHWSEQAEDYDTWDLKGLLEEVAGDWCEATLVAGVEPRGADDAGSVPLEPDRWLDAERFWVVREGRVLGCGGRVRPDAVDAPDWAGPVWGMELRLDAVGEDREQQYEPLSPYPPVPRDLAFTVDRSLPVERVEATIRDAAPPILESLRLFDVYQGEGIQEDRRSLAWRFTFRAADRTLRDVEVEEAMEAIVHALEEEHDARVRTR